MKSVQSWYDTNRFSISGTVPEVLDGNDTEDVAGYLIKNFGPDAAILSFHFPTNYEDIENNDP